jgi:hypothetical protein
MMVRAGRREPEITNLMGIVGGTALRRPALLDASGRPGPTYGPQPGKAAAATNVAYRRHDDSLTGDDYLVNDLEGLDVAAPPISPEERMSQWPWAACQKTENCGLARSACQPEN